MKKLIPIIVFALFSFTALAGETIIPASNMVAKASTMPVYTNADKPIIVSADKPTFTIELKSNPTTGYTWYLQDLNENNIELLDYKFNPPDTKLVGAPGTQHWTFRIKSKALEAPKLLTIKLLYARAWEPLKGKPTNFTVVTG